MRLLAKFAFEFFLRATAPQVPPSLLLFHAHSLLLHPTSSLPSPSPPFLNRNKEKEKEGGKEGKKEGKKEIGRERQEESRRREMRIGLHTCPSTLPSLSFVFYHKRQKEKYDEERRRRREGEGDREIWEERAREGRRALVCAHFPCLFLPLSFPSLPFL